VCSMNFTVNSLFPIAVPEWNCDSNSAVERSRLPQRSCGSREAKHF
jgi:hypothetical protein